MPSGILKLFVRIIALPKVLADMYALCPPKKKNTSQRWAEKILLADFWMHKYSVRKVAPVQGNIIRLLWRTSRKYQRRHYLDKGKHPMIMLWSGQNQPKLKCRNRTTWACQTPRFPLNPSTFSTWRYWLVEQIVRSLCASPKVQRVQQFGQICGTAAVTWTLLNSTAHLTCATSFISQDFVCRRGAHTWASPSSPPSQSAESNRHSWPTLDVYFYRRN